MSKKLLIAVFTLGLLVSFSAFAIADNTTRTDDDAKPITFDGDNSFGDNGVELSGLQGIAVNKPAAQSHPYATPMTIFPPIYYCDAIVEHSNSFLGWEDIGGSGSQDYAFMRFYAYEDYVCTLKTVNIGIDDTAYVGTPDLVVAIWQWEEAGTYPPTELTRIVVPWASLPHTGKGPQWVSVDFSALGFTFEDEEQIRVGITVDDVSRAAGSSIGLLWDDGAVTTTRYGFYHSSGIWAWWGPFQAYAINIDMCVNEFPHIDCETIDYMGGVVNYFTLTDDTTIGYEYFHTRFMTDGIDSLKSIEFGLYDVTDPGVAVDFMVTGEASGYPDLTNIIYTETVAYADLVYWGYTIVFPEPCPTIDGTFFGVVSVNDATPGATGLLADDGGGVGTSGGFPSSTAGWFSTGYNWWINVELCDDKFSLCRTDADYAPCGLAYYNNMPGAYGTQGYFQKIQSSGVGCRIENIHMRFYPDGPYATTCQLRIMDNDGVHDVYDPGGANEFDFGAGLPGTTVYSIDIAGADAILYPAWHTVDVSAENIRFDDYVWAGFEILAPAGSGDMAMLKTDPADAGCYVPNETAIVGIGPFGPWEYNTQGYTYADNFWSAPFFVGFRVDVCCEPPAGAECFPGEDWPVGAHDFRRTNRSMNSTEGAKCTQSLSWYYTNAEGIRASKGVIYDGVLVVQYNNSLRAFDIDDGTVLWTFSTAVWYGSGTRNSICVVDGWVYFGGGSNRGMSRLNVYTGDNTEAGAWSRNFLANVFDGNTTYSAPVVLGDVVYISSTIGEIAAFNIADGTDFAGWTVNPIQVDGDPRNTMSSNGVDVLYVGTNGNNGGDNKGTLYAIDAATGAVNWSMRDTDLLGHDLDDGDGTETFEHFRGSIAVGLENDLYMLTNFEGGEVGGPPSGAFYRIEDGGTSGSVVWGIGNPRQYWNGPTLDINYVYASSWGAWTTDVTVASMRAVNKLTGSVAWSAIDVNEHLNDTGAISFQTVLSDAVLDCRDDVVDILYMPNDNAKWLAMDGSAGTLEFEYSFDPITSDNPGAIMMDATHLVLTNYQGEIFTMTNQVDRPRLRVIIDGIYEPVPFLSPDGFIVTFDDVFMNNGCANLTGTMAAEELAPASYMASSVHPARQERMMRAADNMTDNSYPSFAGKLTKETGVPINAVIEFDESAFSKDSYSNTSAYAQPGWLNNIANASFDLAPDDYSDVVYDVNGPLVTRGTHDCYVTITSNDLYYLNDSTLHPTVMLGVIGGCAGSTDTLYWGNTIQNWSVIYNTGMIAGDAREDGFMISIDLEETYFCYFAGFLMFGQSEHSLAWTGHQDGGVWETLLTDPNCAAQCETYFQRDIVLGSIWNGVDAYVDIRGEAGTYTYIDSMIDYACDDGTTWDWDDTDCPYDNDLTIGLSIKATEYGAYAVPELNNFKITKLDITNRNATPIVDPVYYSHWVDGDLGNDYDDGYDFERYFYLDGYDVVWGGACSDGYEVNTNVWGSGSIGHPMRGCINARSDMLNGNIMYDSMFYWMSNVTGTYYQPDLDPLDPGPAYDCNDDNGDRQVIYLYDGFTFGANETIETGFYIFGYSSSTGSGYNTFDTALIINTAVAAQQFSGFGRGDMNGDFLINLADVVALYAIVNGGGTPPLFIHLSDVNASGDTDAADIIYLADFVFCVGPAPVGEWVLPDICP